VPIGVAGELYIGGAGLARGYVRRPGLTAGRFVPDPVGPAPGARLYRTGDLARHLAGGEIDYLGRVDFQVKVRGLRIELGEIEAALAAHPGLRDAVVVARPSAVGDPRLIAYVVAAGDRRPSPGELRGHLEERIPAFMVPAVFVALDELPLTPNGKLDRKALPEPPAERPDLAAGFVAPATAAERLLARAWQEVLELDRVGVEDRFVDLGGDSILALRVVARARAAGLSLGVRELFERPTIRQLAAAVEPPGPEGLPAEPEPPRPPAAEEPEQPEAPVAAAAGLTAGQRRFVERLGRDVEDAYPLSPLQQGMLFDALYEPEAGRYVSQLAVEAGAGLDPELFRAAWEHVAARHPALRTSFSWQGLDAPLQLVHRRAEVRSVVDPAGLAGPDRETRDRRLDELLAADRRRGFDLGSAPLLRNALVGTGDGWVWLWSFHHLVLDGWSVALVLDELFTAYRALGRGEDPGLGPAPPFADFIAALGRRDRAAEEAYWRRLLAGFTAPTRLGIDRGESAGDRPPEVYEQRRLRLGAELAAALRELARGAGLTVNLVLQGAWALLLGRYSGEREVVFGTAVSGRPPELAGVEAMVGLLINALPVRVELPGAAPLGEWLGDLQAQQHDSLRYELTSLADLQRWSELPRGVPLFETFFAFQAEGAEEVLERVGGDLGLRRLRALGMSSHPLTLSASAAGEISLTLTFDPRRFTGEAVDRLAVHLRNLLAAMAEGGSLRRLDELSMLTAEELRREAAGGAGDGWGAAGAPPPPEAVDELSDSEVDALLAELLDSEEPS
jgi:aryl carrier-like protein